ncbi:hypothetical protein ACFVZD_40440 [Streptomyces sp. NPDC058287]|uniref:hypothetical protein n=1 Tax=Streptomyces sp. NPDC058287 TaxID=3346423 RepID=UPI0036E2B18C
MALLVSYGFWHSSWGAVAKRYLDVRLLIAGESTEAVAAAQAAVDAPDGIGTIGSYATEVALPVKGTWKNPAIGRARADVVVITPDDDVPLLLIEVDDCTEGAVLIAAKFDKYARFQSAPTCQGGARRTPGHGSRPHQPAPQDGELVPRYENLRVLRRLRSRRQRNPPQDLQEDQVQQSQSHASGWRPAWP